MPLSINVGLSRKASRDFQSTGVSINLTAELDQSLLARPEELQQHIDSLYSQVQLALDRRVEAIGQRQEQSEAMARRPTDRSSRPGNNGNGDGNGNGAGRNIDRMTPSQRRAITAIASRVGADPAVEARELVGAELDLLTIRQASELIDHLKNFQSADDNRR